MHIGISSNLMTVLNHYDSIVVSPGNTTIDNRLIPGGNPQQLQLTLAEKNQLIAFIGTLSGSDIYTNPKWSDPFTNGVITISNTTSISLIEKELDFTIYPNPTINNLNINYPDYFTNTQVQIFSTGGRLVMSQIISSSLNVSNLKKGVYFIKIGDVVKKFIKE
jgi:cytochrome c peroxidase